MLPLHISQIMPRQFAFLCFYNCLNVLFCRMYLGHLFINVWILLILSGIHSLQKYAHDVDFKKSNLFPYCIVMTSKPSLIICRSSLVNSFFKLSSCLASCSWFVFLVSVLVLLLFILAAFFSTSSLDFNCFYLYALLRNIIRKLKVL